MPVGLSMLIAGLLGNIAIRGWQHALPSLSSETFAIASFYQLSVIPMFVLMGNIAGASGMGRDLYNAAYAWVGHIRGGLASATIIACACFASLCGSSAASAVTMGRVALPEMRRYKYDDALATGTVASGGTLGFTFPPSAGLVIYGILTEQAIGRLFLAGVVPGIILTLLFIATILIVTTIRREAGPPGPRASMAERIATLGRASSIVLVVFVTIGGIYLGLFTPIEASGFGASFTLLVALVRRKLSWPVMKAIVLQTMRTTATVFLILMGAYVFIPFMTLSELPEIVVRFLLSFDLGTTGILIIIILTYLALGTFMEDFSMLILTLPVVLPVLKALEVDLVWFGVVAVLIIQMGLLSPPVGINVFIVKGIVPDVPMYTIFRGIWPFWYAMGLLIALLLMFPQLALFLPNTMLRERVIATGVTSEREDRDMYYQDASWLDTAGRLLIVAFFLAVGLRNLQKVHIEDHVKRLTNFKAPFPKLTFWIGQTMEFVGCALVLLNWYPAVGVVLLLVFTVVASALLLRFWEVDGPMRTGMQNGMLANIGIVGGLLCCCRTCGCHRKPDFMGLAVQLPWQGYRLG